MGSSAESDGQLIVGPSPNYVGSDKLQAPCFQVEGAQAFRKPKVPLHWQAVMSALGSDPQSCMSCHACVTWQEA